MKAKWLAVALFLISELRCSAPPPIVSGDVPTADKQSRPLVKEHGRGNNATNEASYDLVQLGLECISRLEKIPLAYDFTERFDVAVVIEPSKATLYLGSGGSLANAIVTSSQHLFSVVDARVAGARRLRRFRVAQTREVTEKPRLRKSLTVKRSEGRAPVQIVVGALNTYTPQAGNQSNYEAPTARTNFRNR